VSEDTCKHNRPFDFCTDPHCNPAVCEDCGLRYPLGRADVPITAHPYTCDDCGGYVDVPS